MDNFEIERLRNFLNNIPESERIAFVTSGGSLINLDQSNKLEVQNFSTGKRGAICAEELLINKYNVIFLYREESAIPFMHYISMNQLFKNSIVELNELVFLNNCKETFINYKRLYEKYAGNLFLFPFDTVLDFHFKKDFILKTLNSFRERCVVLLSAVNNYYMNKENCKDLQLDKGLSFELRNIHNEIDKLKKHYLPDCLLITFQNCGEENKLSDQSQYLVQLRMVDYVVTSTEESRHDKIVMMNLTEKFEVYKEEIKPAEEKFIKLIVCLHNINIENMKNATG